jgi:hypothetical protein
MLTQALRSVAPLRSGAVPRQVTALAATRARALSSTSAVKSKEEITRPAIDTPLSLWNFTEEEEMLRETGQLTSFAIEGYS